MNAYWSRKQRNHYSITFVIDGRIAKATSLHWWRTKGLIIECARDEAQMLGGLLASAVRQLREGGRT